MNKAFLESKDTGRGVLKGDVLVVLFLGEVFAYECGEYVFEVRSTLEFLGEGRAWLWSEGVDAVGFEKVEEGEKTVEDDEDSVPEDGSMGELFAPST